jgi:hypothetical protein
MGEGLEVKVEGTPEEIEAAIDAAINNFEAFMIQNSGSSPLIKAEKAIIKTFLIYKTRKKF